jgi:malonyl-CoA/methylmalonyl-CoA synthetase
VTAHAPPDPSFAPRALGERSLPEVWAGHWGRFPERPVLFDSERGWLSWGGLEAATADVAARLGAAGLSRGDRVLISAPSSRDHAVVLVACLRLGLVIVPVNPAYRASELEALAREAAPRVADIEAAAHQACVRPLASVRMVAAPRDLVSSGAPPPSGASPPSLDAVGPESPALLAYTSGTTGRPKGVLLSHGNLHASAEALRSAWRWGPEDRLIHVLPLFHMHGFGVALLGTLEAGASTLLLPRFEPGAVLEAARSRAATLFFGVPTMWHRLAEEPGVAALGSLRLCVSGSAPLPPALHARLAERAGIAVLERYGMTETGMLASNPVAGERRPGAVGFPLPGVEIRLAEANGEIEVRGPNVFAGYLDRPEANAAAFTRDGWFRTGDLGALDADGALRIVGRVKELVISGGYNVHPQEVEEVLRAHPGIEDAAVVGTPSPEWGERVTAYLVGPEPLSLDALRRHCAERLAPYKHPRELHWVAALPRNALGKLQRHRLRDGRVLPE